MPKYFEWLEIELINVQVFPAPGDRAAVAYLEIYDSDSPQEPAKPWKRRECFKKMTKLMVRRALRPYYMLIWPTERFAVNSVSATLRVFIDKGINYLKESNETEGRIIQLAPKISPDLVRRTLEAHADEG